MGRIALGPRGMLNWWDGCLFFANYLLTKYDSTLFCRSQDAGEPIRKHIGYGVRR